LKSDLDSKTVFRRKTILQSKFICKILYRHIKLYHNKTEKLIIKKPPNNESSAKTNGDELSKLIVDTVSNIKNNKQRNKLFNLLLERELSAKLKDKDLELELKNKDLECASKINDIYENENKFHKKVVENAGQIVNKTMNMLTYATQNFKETPKLETLDSTTARKMLKHEVNGGKNIKVNDDQVAEYIAKISEAKILPKHLGNTLVSHYKKDDPNRQSIWTTDVNRIKFIAKTSDG
jgi:hypothetical protein